MKRLVLLFAATLTAGVAFATGVKMRHTVTLQPGWNAFFLPVTPDKTADQVFENWPVDTVGFYDQSSFQQTRQFTTSAADTANGAIDGGMRMWKRGDPGHSSFDTLVANGVYVAVNTNRTAFTADIYGEPAAYRASWYVTDGVTRPINYAGISSSGSTRVTADGYLSGLSTEWTGRWIISGRPTLPAPTLTAITRNPILDNGDVVAMDSQKVSDWSGPLFVSPSAGLSLGTNLCTGVTSVRNDAGVERRVRISFLESECETTWDELPQPKLLYLDRNVHTTWQASLADVPYEKTLLPGETLALNLAVDRSRDMRNAAVGAEFGGRVTVEDVSEENPSAFRTTIPFSICADGGEFQKNMWPKGLWSAAVSLDRVSMLTDPIPTAKPMNLRLLLYVNAHGKLNLVQRVGFGGRRLSAVALQPDQPTILGTGTFGETASFVWNVAEDSNVNPFRHALHPDHATGLAVSNELVVAWSPSRSASWSPEETLSGEVIWALIGLRHEGPITMKGSFEMRRLTVDDLETILEK